MIGYKVTSMFESAIIPGEKYCLEYRVGRITKTLPGTMGIFCFVSLSSAKVFTKERLRQNPFVEILEVEFSSKISRPLIVSKNLNGNILDSFYRGNKEYERKLSEILDIVCCDSVKVNRILWESFSNSSKKSI